MIEGWNKKVLLKDKRLKCKISYSSSFEANTKSDKIHAFLEEKSKCFPIHLPFIYRNIKVSFSSSFIPAASCIQFFHFLAWERWPKGFMNKKKKVFYRNFLVLKEMGFSSMIFELQGNMKEASHGNIWEDKNCLTGKFNEFKIVL